jgi:hypothetical protein
LPSHFLAGLTLQVAQDDDAPILVGQADQLLVKYGLEITPPVLWGHGWFGHRGHLPFSLLPLGGGRPGLQGRLVSHAIEPVGQQLPGSNRRCLTDEDKEGGLEGVLGIVVVPENTAAHPPDHRPMPLHKGCESRLVTAADVVLQQLAIGQARTVPQDAAEVLHDPVHRAGCHVPSFAGATLTVYLITTRRRRFDTRLSLTGAADTTGCGGQAGAESESAAAALTCRLHPA